MLIAYNASIYPSHMAGVCSRDISHPGTLGTEYSPWHWNSVVIQLRMSWQGVPVHIACVETRLMKRRSSEWYVSTAVLGAIEKTYADLLHCCANDV